MAEILILDSITARPGKAGEILEAYLEDYAVGARQRGMTLRHSLISPPVKQSGDRTNSLSFLWSVDGVEGWWKMRLASVFDPAVREFWEKLDPLVLHRERSFHEEASRHV